jgi:hypothetical protein
MKTIKFLSFTLAVGFALNSSGQTWIDSNPVWHYDYSAVSLTVEVGFYKTESVGQQTLNGKTCEILETTRHSFPYNFEGVTEYAGATIIDSNYTYQSGDTVFYYQNNEFRILYNFGASIGESWLVHVSSSPPSFCNDSTFVIVDDAGLIDVEGTDYRYISLSAQFPDQKMALGGMFVERFGAYSGGNDNFLFPTKSYCYATEVQPEFSFLCFQDDLISLGSTGNCEYHFDYVGTEELTSENPTIIIQNPFGHRMQLDILDAQPLALSDSNGKILFESNDPELIEVYSEKLKSGLYFLNIVNQNKIYRLIKL